MNTKQQIAQQRANLAIAEFLKELILVSQLLTKRRNLRWSVPNRMSMPHLLLKEKKR